MEMATRLTDLCNDLITLRPDKNNTWRILYKENDAGYVKLHIDTNKAEISFFIQPEYRGKHLAANAIYLLTPELHSAYNLRSIHAVIDKENEMAKHVLEHNGYAIVSKDNEHIYYVHQKAETRRDDNYHPAGKAVLYFAGGCFWGTERIFQMLDGVTDTTAGYANGHTPNPTYEEVCRDETGYRETVRVTWDPSILSEETLLDAYFLCIDPTQKNAQASDTGSQYQTGVYYRDPSLLSVIEKKFNDEKKKHASFYVELKPLDSFYEAEEYHQDYLIKQPDGYCHITPIELEKVKALNNRR